VIINIPAGVFPDPVLVPAPLPIAPQVNNYAVEPAPFPVLNNVGNINRAPLGPPDPDPAPHPAQMPLAPQVNNFFVDPFPVPIHNNGDNINLAPLRPPDPDPAPDPAQPPLAPQVNNMHVDPIPVQVRNNGGNINMVPLRPPDPDPALDPALLPIAPQVDPIPIQAHNNGGNINMVPLRPPDPDPAPDPAPLPVAPLVNNLVMDPVPAMMHNNDVNNNLAPLQPPEPDPGQLPVPVPLRNFNLPVRRYGAKECNRNTGKLEAFADDKTALGKAERAAFTAISSILTCFAMISGLRCNIDKSMVMYIGSDDPAPDYILESGFQVVDKVKILGVEISRKYQDLNTNFNGTIDKITKICRFWERFRLSLPGRINVAKTLMLSQISYVGAIVKPTDEQITTMQTIIDNFILGNMRFSKKFVNISVEKGGLGMIDVKEFVIGLQCSWELQLSRSVVDPKKYFSDSDPKIFFF
jgi:hypothetical protein